MSAEYVSPKPDGYLAIRNEVYQDRRKKLEARAMQEQAVLRDLPPQSQANYGKKLDK